MVGVVKDILGVAMTETFIFRDEPTKEGSIFKIDTGLAEEVIARWPDNSWDCCVTSPPYFNKMDYGVAGQWGREERVGAYISKVRELAKQLYRTAQNSANLFWVIDDSNNGSGGLGGDYQDENGNYKVRTCRGAQIKTYPRKGQLLIPEWTRIAFSLAGWIPRHVIIWDKRNPRRAAKDRPSYSYEQIQFYSKTGNNYWDRDAVLRPYADASLTQLETKYEGKAQYDYASTGQEDPSDAKRRMVDSMRARVGVRLIGIWQISSGSQPVVEVDGKEVRGIASFPLLLAEICILLGCPPDGRVIDPFCGLATTGVAAVKWGRMFNGVELNPLHAEAGRQRILSGRFV